jgi:proton-coupled amino acid transporter
VQSGVCLTYLIFVPQNLKKACHDFGWEVSTSFFLSLMVLVQIPLSWIRDIRHLTLTNALANSLIMYGLITCLGFAFQDAIVPVQNVEEENGGEDDGDGNDEDSQRGPMAEIVYKFFHLKAFNSSGWFLFIGTSVS